MKKISQRNDDFEKQSCLCTYIPRREFVTMKNEISKNEMKTLLSLMQRIEKFEILYSTQNWAIERLKWGLSLDLQS